MPRDATGHFHPSSRAVAQVRLSNRRISRNQREVSYAHARFVDLFPESSFAETLRSVSVSVAGRGPENSKVIGVLSVAPQEGRSLVAANLATLLGQGEGPTLLIDGDTRNPHLSRIFAPDAKVGLLDVLAGTCSWTDALRCGPIRGVATASDAKTSRAAAPKSPSGPWATRRVPPGCGNSLQAHRCRSAATECCERGEDSRKKGRLRTPHSEMGGNLEGTHTRDPGGRRRCKASMCWRDPKRRRYGTDPAIPGKQSDR